MQNIPSHRQCKSHPDQIADYFVVTEPWQKICKQCALNLALCGHKIDREMSCREFQNKLTLNSLIDQLKLVIAMADEEGKTATVFLSKIDRAYHDATAEMVQQIDAHIKQICSIRDSISKIYEENIRRQVNLYNDHKNRVIAESSCLKKHLQNLQANYCDLIEEDSSGNKSLQRQVQLIRKQIQKIQKGFIIKLEANNIQQQIIDVDILFKQQFTAYKNSLTNFKFKSMEEEQKKLKQKKDQQNLQNKQPQEKTKQRQSFNPKTSFKSRHQKNKENDYAKCISQRKKSSIKEIIDQSCSATHRATNLSLRSIQRRNTTNNNSNIPKVRQFEDSLRMNI